MSARLLLTLSENVDKVGHGVVVAAVQGIEGVNEEVDQRASGGNRPVHLPGLANGQLSLLGLLHLLCNVHCRALGLLQVLNQSNVLQNVTLHAATSSATREDLLLRACQLNNDAL